MVLMKVAFLEGDNRDSKSRGVIGGGVGGAWPGSGWGWHR